MKKKIGEKIYQKVICECGCGQKYWKCLNPDEIYGFEILSYTGEKDSNTVLKIKRLSDNVEFRLGDNIRRFQPVKNNTTDGIIYNFQIEDSGFAQIWCYSIGSTGIFSIPLHKKPDNIVSDFNHIKKLY